ncbi:hypothetical protein D046_1324B, partial [Vibrio parahaemolyticus V-223/04]
LDSKVGFVHGWHLAPALDKANQ